MLSHVLSVSDMPKICLPRPQSEIDEVKVMGEPMQATMCDERVALAAAEDGQVKAEACAASLSHQLAATAALDAVLTTRDKAERMQPLSEEYTCSTFINELQVRVLILVS
jgi:hypothetical protein